MKKSEMDKLRELVKLWNQAIYSPLYAAASPLSNLLDTFEVDPDPIEEVRPGVGVIKESTSVLTDWEDNICHDCQGNGQIVTEHHEPDETKDCPKCGGAGWVWDYELDENPNDIHDAGIDDTRYSCDACRKTREKEEILYNFGKKLSDAQVEMPPEFNEVFKDLQPILSIAPEVDPEVEKRVDDLVNKRLNKTKTKPLKRKWHKWSELKDKYFSKEKQKEMKEQAEKELRVEQSCVNCGNKNNCQPFDRTECFCHSLSNWRPE